MRLLTKYILPATLVAGFLFFFIQTAFFDHCPNPDDPVYDGMVRKFGIAETIKLLFKIDTGRWFSHLIVGPSFYFLGHDFFRYGLFLSLMMILFIASIFSVYKNYCLTFVQQKLAFSSTAIFSLTTTATVFFMLFEGRLQSFGWVSSSINHLLSVTLCAFLFGRLLKESQTVFNTVLVCMLSLFIGGSNEVNAICMILSVGILFFFSLRFFPQIKLSRLNMVFAIVLIALSLIINISSGGYEGRMNGLPSFDLSQSVKNTVHSFLMPFLNYLYLPAFLGGVVAYILFLKRKDRHYSKTTLWVFGAAAILCLVSFFLNCFLLSDVVPARASLWAYTLAVLTIGLYLASNKRRSKIS